MFKDRLKLIDRKSLLQIHLVFQRERHKRDGCLEDVI